jgi:hypothetical protein
MRKKLLAMLAVSAFALGSASAFADLGEDMVRILFSAAFSSPASEVFCTTCRFSARVSMSSPRSVCLNNKKEVSNA